MSKQIELHINLSTVLNQIEYDDLVAEVCKRRLEDRLTIIQDVDEEKIREEEYKDLKRTNHVLSKMFDRFQLRDHLIDIAGLQTHVSDETLFNKLSDLLEFS